MENASKANIKYTLSSLFARNALQVTRPPRCASCHAEVLPNKKGRLSALKLGAMGFSAQMPIISPLKH